MQNVAKGIVKSNVSAKLTTPVTDKAPEVQANILAMPSVADGIVKSNATAKLMTLVQDPHSCAGARACVRVCVCVCASAQDQDR